MIIRESISEALRRVGRTIRHPRPILQAMGVGMEQIARASFSDPAMRAAPWAPLKPATIKRKKGRGGILRGPNAIMARAWNTTSTDDKAEVSNDRPYAVYHQFGTRRGLPARPMLPIVIGAGNSFITLAPWAHERLRKLGQAKLDSLLR